MSIGKDQDARPTECGRTTTVAAGGAAVHGKWLRLLVFEGEGSAMVRPQPDALEDLRLIWSDLPQPKRVDDAAP